MYSDITGYAPKWLESLGWIGLGVGISLCVAAVVVLTCGVGALAGTMGGAILYGAAQGTLIGAAIGSGVGVLAGGIGAAISGESISGGEFWSDVLFGAMAGFGIGSFIGAVSGGFIGAHSFSVNSAYISQNGGNVRQVLSAFKGNPKLTAIGNDTTAFRYWGGGTPKFGHWVSPIDYGSSARSMLSLPGSNSMQFLSSFSINGGSYVLQ
jgi:hypothetical protein